jgi:hypothetical protein
MVALEDCGAYGLWLEANIFRAFQPLVSIDESPLISYRWHIRCNVTIRKARSNQSLVEGVVSRQSIGVPSPASGQSWIGAS